MRSMTGFGAATADGEGESLTVEVRTVNHRFADVKVRLPRELAALETGIAARVRTRIERGSVDLTVRRATAGGQRGRVRLDLELARAYVDRLAELGSALGLSGEPAVLDVAGLEGVLALEEAPVDLERLEGLAMEAVDAALSAVVAMREQEGLRLAEDLEARLARVSSLVEEIRREAPAVVVAYRERLASRLTDLTKDAAVDPQRLATEAAIFADRADVAEELTRLSSHLEQLGELLRVGGAVGRKLDFLLQETNREVNTVGSKGQSTAIAQKVVDLKAELERIREQVQNVE